MIVFPARRSVALKVATASSRVETLPMFVRSRPSRTRRTISPSWARSDSTTKSTARPSSGPRLGRPDDGHQRPSGSNQACGPLRDVAAEDIEHQIDPADVFQGVVLEVDELLRAEVERRLTVGRAPGADDVRAGLACELRRHRTDYAGRAVHEDALPRLKAAVLEQSLPRGQARASRRLAPTVKSTSPGSGARLRASTATYSASVPSRCQSVRPNTRCPTDSPVVP